MPTTTFFNLSDSKRNQFIEESFIEFASHTYQYASINAIIKRLGIARGSVYQYFEDKLDLWFYLKDCAEQQKLKFIQEIDRDDFDSFWDYYKAIFVNGLGFDEQFPNSSRFLYLLSVKEHSPVVTKYIDSWKQKAYEFMKSMVEDERNAGDFSKEIPTEMIVHFLIITSMSISELLQKKYQMNFEENILTSGSVLANRRPELLAAIDDLMFIVERALKSGNDISK